MRPALLNVSRPVIVVIEAPDVSAASTPFALLLNVSVPAPKASVVVPFSPTRPSLLNVSLPALKVFVPETCQDRLPLFVNVTRDAPEKSTAPRMTPELFNVTAPEPAVGALTAKLARLPEFVVMTPRALLVNVIAPPVEINRMAAFADDPPALLTVAAL